MPIMYFGDHAMRALIHSPTPTLSAKAWRLPPRCLASYIAPSARASSWSASDPSSGKIAIPMLTPRRSPCIASGAVTACMIRSATSRACSRPPGPPRTPRPPPAGPTQQHDDLAPAETCHGIDGAGGSLEPPRRLAQHEVAGRMAMDVIDWLETVEI